MGIIDSIRQRGELIENKRGLAKFRPIRISIANSTQVNVSKYSAVTHNVYAELCESRRLRSSTVTSQRTQCKLTHAIRNKRGFTKFQSIEDLK